MNEPTRGVAVPAGIAAAGVIRAHMPEPDPPGPPPTKEPPGPHPEPERDPPEPPMPPIGDPPPVPPDMPQAHPTRRANAAMYGLQS
ncbi:hypothetical protein FNF07_08185 [Trinickia caryophylli]|nr:hypothetical protein C0Z17_21260 [Trinickia caryophylli]TRX18197.1 hypothetical protein FNF07_08185 [Trinickia caryophylli]